MFVRLFSKNKTYEQFINIFLFTNNGTFIWQQDTGMVTFEIKKNGGKGKSKINYIKQYQPVIR